MCNLVSPNKGMVILLSTGTAEALCYFVSVYISFDHPRVCLSLSSLQKVSPLQSQLLSHAQQLHQEVETYDQRLSEVTHSLEQARKWRGDVTNKTIYVRREAASAHAKVKVLLEKRKEMGRQLQLRKRELSFCSSCSGS